LFVSLLVACGETANPNVCCVTEAQCADLGAAELRPCGEGQACTADYTCIAAECTTNVDCAEDAPVCRLGFCESGCTVDDDCAEVTGRTHCGPDATCVGCVDSSQCTGTTAICDMEDYTCRGCEIDSECASGVCIEIDGVCAEEARVIYAAGVGAPTSGECTRDTPCKLDYALTKVRSDRDVVHLVSGTANLPTTTINVVGGLVLDGSPTLLNASTASPTITADNAATLTLEGVLLGNGFRATSMNAVMRLYDVESDRAKFSSTGGTLIVDKSTFRGDPIDPAVACGNCTFSFRRSRTIDSSVSAAGSTAMIEMNRFEASQSTGALSVSGGKATVENDVFVTSDSATDMVYMIGGLGSVFRFNTVVSTNTSTYSAAAIYCDAAIGISNNIFAYNSTNPISGNGTCTITSSLFDTQGTSDAGSNAVADRATFFVDLSQSDFHLKAGSPARDAGEPGLVDTDIEGAPRDSMPDIGAYEAK
jgi:hypothetical protein